MDSLNIGFMLYFQVGLVLLGYLFCRRVRALRTHLLTIEADLEATVQNFEARLSTIASRGVPAEVPSPAPACAESSTCRETKREIAFELAKSGFGTAGIAERLEMQPVEVDLLLKVSRCRRGRPAEDLSGHSTSPPHMLDVPGVAAETAG